MKLYYSPASPYARKVRIVASEKGIKLELIAVVASDNPPELHAANPVGKVPTLITDNGTAIPESQNICLYLDGLKSTPQLFGHDVDVLRRDALAVGIMDASVRHVLEMRRPKEKHFDIWIERQVNAITRTLAVLEKESGTLTPDFTLDQITLAAALGYLELRLPEMNWKPKHPKLAAWYEKILKRPSVAETVPPAA